MIRALLAAFVVLAWPALGHADCGRKNATQIAQILAHGINLNERFKRSVKSGDDMTYRSLRKQHEQYSEDLAMPCLRKASQLLEHEMNEPLLEKSVAFAISHENSADETVSEAMAIVFAYQPAAIAASLSKLSPSRSGVLLRSIEGGWPKARKRLDPSDRQERDAQLTALRKAQIKSGTVK